MSILMDLLDRLLSGWKAWLILFAITFTAAAPGVFHMPAMDRDESRFAQASKQYIETGDYLIIRYQDEYRNKKPAGIHWLQSGATHVLGEDENLDIWTYRVPSWLGAAFATLATFWCGIVLIGRRAAFLGAALLPSPSNHPTLLNTSPPYLPFILPSSTLIPFPPIHPTLCNIWRRYNHPARHGAALNLVA